MRIFILRLTGALILGAFGALISLSLLTLNPNDQSILFGSSVESVTVNGAGSFGANLSGFLLYFLGNTAFLLVPVTLIFFAGLLGCFNIRKNWDRLLSILSLVFLSSFIENYYSLVYLSGLYPGGAIGNYGIKALEYLFEPFGTGLFLFVATWSLLIIIDGFSSVRLVRPLIIYFLYPTNYILLRAFSTILVTAKKYIKKSVVFVLENLSLNNLSFNHTEQDEISLEVEQIFTDPFWFSDNEKNIDDALSFQELDYANLEVDQNLVAANNNFKLKVNKNSDLPLSLNKANIYKLPFSLFETNISINKNKQDYKIKEQEQAELLEQKLNKFGILGKVVSITSGPVVTLFEYAPRPETKISTILAREDDLALALEALSLRIIAPIPGKSVVGFEVAHRNPEPVLFQDLINRSKKKIANLSLPLLLGTDTEGLPVVVDLLKLPHLLLAGTTGSGKSVAVQNMIMTILCHKAPDIVKLILIDPKRLELSVYQDIGHLLFPVVTESKQALAVLNWSLNVMEERYSILAQAGVKNCLEYHALQENNRYEMPFIVIVIDELADLMMTAGKDLEIALVRLAQMARASGIHLITATQRPSVDIVTGLIKVNFPSRLACKVASKTDSRTILDISGAEKLLGKGDMLFLNPSSGLQRVHGAYVNSEEIEKVADSVRAQCEPQYQDLDLFKDKAIETNDNMDDQDELFDKAVEFVKSRQEVSISLIQRMFRIGYNRSARLIDQLESSGYILPPSGSKMRKVNSDLN